LDKKRIITIVSVVLMSVLLIYGGILANQVFSKNTKFSEKELYVQVPTGSSYEEVKKIHITRFPYNDFLYDSNWVIKTEE